MQADDLLEVVTTAPTAHPDIEAVPLNISDGISGSQRQIAERLMDRILVMTKMAPLYGGNDRYEDGTYSNDSDCDR